MVDFKAKARELVAQMTLAEKCSQLRFDAPAIKRLGIPAYNWWNECLHGVARAGTATVFPQAIALAATWNPKLVKKVATAISDEARAKYNECKKFGDTLQYQGLTMWSPNINIFRDPRWGRGHETYGEDPYLTSRIACAFVEGLQGDHPVYRKVDSTIKHFAVHSGPEALRHSFDAVVSKKDLYETYLAAFEYVIKHAKPAAVMCAYNRVNGEPCCGSPTLLGEILRKQFGFEGYVVSDCGAICDINRHHRVTSTEAESAALALNNGCQLNCGSAYHSLLAAVAQGLISEDVITRACEMLFETRFKLGMFADDCPYDNIDYDVVECEKHIKLSRKAARKSMVLLKNDGILPLNNTKDLTIAVIGPNADERTTALANYNGIPSEIITLLMGIKQAAKGKVYYAMGCRAWRRADETLLREAVIAAQKSDVVLLFLGLTPAMEGEEGDAALTGGDKRDLDWPEVQRELFEAVMAVGKPTVLINISGSAVNLALAKERCNAIMQVFYPGAQGGAALADLIFGKYSPSGRLPVTFYRSVDELPPFEDYNMEGRTYKYFRGEPVFPFGHGLTYTTFEYGGFTAVQSEDNIKVSVTIKNTGGYKATEVAQLYFKPAWDMPGAPNKVLIGFENVKLKPGHESKVEFELTREDFSLYNESGERVFTPGEYELICGTERLRVTLK